MNIYRGLTVFRLRQLLIPAIFSNALLTAGNIPSAEPLHPLSTSKVRSIETAANEVSRLTGPFSRTTLVDLSLFEALIGGSTTDALRTTFRLGPATVLPSNGTMTAPSNTSVNDAWFEVDNPDYNPENYSLFCWVTGSISSCSDPGYLFVDAWGAASVDVTFATGGAGDGSVNLSAGGLIGGNDGHYDVSVQNTRVAPGIAVASVQEYRDVTRCVAECFEYTTSYSTPAYVSRNATHTASLVYRSGSAHPIGVIQLDVTDNSITPADSFQLQVQQQGGGFVTFLNGSQSLYFQSKHQTGAVTRVVAAFDAAGMNTGAYLYTAITTSLWQGAQLSTNTGVRIIVLNEAGSRFGAGWTLAGFQHAYVQSDGVLITDGTGSASFYTGHCAAGNACTFGQQAEEFATLMQSETGALERRYPDGTFVDFWPTGNESLVGDRFSHTISYFAYNNDGTLSSIQDQVGQNISFSYSDGSAGWKVGSLRSIQTPGGRTSWFGVNATNDLVQLQDPDNIYFGYADYYTDHRLSHFRDRRGGDWNAAYSWDGTIQSVQSPTVVAMVNGTSQSVRPTTTYSGPGTRLFAAIQSGYGTWNNPVRNNLDVRATITNPRGAAITYTVNRWGAPTQIVSPVNGISYSMEYDPSTGLRNRSVGIAGHDIRYTWNGANLTRVMDVSTGATVNAHYEPTYNQPDSIWGSTITRWFFYDGTRLGKPITSTRRGVVTAALTQYVVDDFGRITQVTDEAGHVSKTFYGASGLQNTDSILDPGARVTRYRRDNYGRLVAQVSPDGVTKDSIEYDALNRQTAGIDGKNRRTTYRYDSLFVRAIVDPTGQRDSLVRNALGWITEEWRPGSTTALRGTYDVNGNLVGLTNRRGQSISIYYDQIDRDTLRTAGTDSARFEYGIYSTPVSGIAGYVLGRSGARIDTQFFDIEGRIKRTNSVIAGNYYALTYSYNSDGSLARRDAASNTWTGNKTLQYGYNAVDALQSLTAFGQQTTLAFNNENLTTQITYPSGLVNGDSITSNHERYLSKYTGTSSSDANTRLGVGVLLDANGRIAQRRRAVGDSLKMYLYDPDHFFTNRQIFQSLQQTCQYESYSFDSGYSCQSSEQMDHPEPYAYDDAGNLTNGVSQIDPGNRVRIVNGYTYHYDSDGNVDSKSGPGFTQSLSWNAFGQLSSATTNGNTVLFSYDAFGRRASKGPMGFPKYYVYDGDNIFLELDRTGTVTAEYASWPGVDNPHSVQRGGQTYYFAAEPVSGSIHGLIRASDNAVVALYGYTPYGQLESGSFDNISGQNWIRFAGREYDTETGLYYFRSRYYDPFIGRFVSEDGIGADGGMNMYQFADNDPVNGSDPGGTYVGGKSGGCVKWKGVCVSLRWGKPKYVISGHEFPGPFPGRGPGIWSSPQGPFKPVIGPTVGPSAGRLGKPGVYIGTIQMTAVGITFGHSAIAIEYPNNPVAFVELRGWAAATDALRLLKNQLYIGNTPMYGAVTDYTWTYAGLPSDINRVVSSINWVNQGYIGERYHVADSNRMVKDVMDMSGLELTKDQKTLLGWAPALTAWFFP